MAIAAQEREVVLATNRCNPQVVGRDGLASFFQFKADGRVDNCSILIDVKDANRRNPFLEPAFVAQPVSGLRDSQAVLA